MSIHISIGRATYLYISHLPLFLLDISRHLYRNIRMRVFGSSLAVYVRSIALRLLFARATRCTMALPVFSPEHTPDGELPPWEIAKAFAFHVVLSDVAKHLGMEPKDLVDGRVGSYIASKVLLKGGDHPTERSIQKTIARCKLPDWYPGKGRCAGADRPPTYTEHQKAEVARVAMELKRKRIAPTPRRVRQRLPHSSNNP